MVDRPSIDREIFDFFFTTTERNLTTLALTGSKNSSDQSEKQDDRPDI